MTGKQIKRSSPKTKVLFILQEMVPYTPDSELGSVSRNLPQRIQELGKEIRIMMPFYGLINPRSHQIHEVYRLSNSVLTINDDDKPLCIRVGAIPSAKLQTYFIDNEELYKRKHLLYDEKKEFFKDNDERMLFFCKGVLETIRQLNWSPDIIHCLGWMTSPIPLLIKTIYQNDPLFANSKVIYTVFNDDFPGRLGKDYQKKLTMDGIVETKSKELSDPTFENITKNAMVNADAIIVGSPDINTSISDYMNANQFFILTHQPSENVESINNFYEDVLKNKNL
jgi:starch synthase